MATTPTSSAAGRRHARQDSNGGITPLRPQASSPTLTNPDMILPDYDDPEPIHTRLQLQLQHQSFGWGAMPPDSDHMFDFPDVIDSSTSTSYPLNTPIIYGNGTMLSDIGEVTEVESNVGGPSRQLSGRSNPSRRSNYSDDNLAARLGSPSLSAKQFAHRTVRNNPRDSRASIDSANTIPAHHGGVFADFDDAVSIDDSNFQGDDEESVASSYIDDHGVPRGGAMLGPQSSDLSLNDDRYSTSSISRRAEQILANAKRRLTTMEGNLTRARTFSYSSVSDGSTPSPIRTPKSPGFKNVAHARNASEISMSTTPRQAVVPQRSASALGAAGGYRQPLPMSRSVESVGHGNHAISQHPLDLALEPLSEDDATTRDRDDSSDTTQVARYASPTFSGYNESGMARSASVAQMRGIQDQMAGLKGKIFTLREQAQADSMKRRSLQSLRTPSLFTNAIVDGEDSDSKPSPKPDEESPGLGSPFQPEFAPEDKAPPAQSDLQSTPPWKRAERDLVVARHSPMQNLHQQYLKDENTPPNNSKAAAAKEKFAELERTGYAEEDDDMYTENGDAEEDRTLRDLDAADSVSESGESLYHETHQHPVSHEDREDAFDYENFFLHSAMGHVSRTGYHNGEDDSGSDCSDNSVETTRAAPTTASGRPRRPSLDTTTSVDTFATADEGRGNHVSAANAVGPVDDGYESPVIGVPLQSADKRLAFGAQESGSSSEDSRSSQERFRRQGGFAFRPAAMAAAAVGHPQRIGLHRPSVSSFESTGTNRSFPLINKARISGNTSPRDSPDMMLRSMRGLPQNRRSSLNEQVLTKMSNGSMTGSGSSLDGSANGSVTGSVIGPSSAPMNGSAHGALNGGPVNGSYNGAMLSPAAHTLQGNDQVYVDRLLASIQKCAAGLRDTTPSGKTMHDTYRRRLEAARLILDGDPDSF